MKKKRDIVRNVIEALFVGIIIFVMSVFGFLSSLDHMLMDKLYQAPRGINSNIKIIAIDDRTLETYGPIGTWSREMYADIINTLNVDESCRPSVIAFDILFSGNVDEGDEAFALAAKESGNVVVVSQFVYNEKFEYDDNGLLTYPVDYIIYPFDELHENVKVGFSNISCDTDNLVRRFKTVEEYDGQQMQMFAKEVYDVYCESQGKENVDIPTDKYGRTLINYSGKPGDYEAISLVDLLDKKIDPRAFQGSIVLVGAYTSGMQDNFYVPNGGSSQMFGVEVHANIIQSFLDERFAVPGNPYMYALIWAAVGFIVHLLFRKLKPLISVIVLVVVIVVQFRSGVILNNKGISVSLIYLPVMLVISYMYCLAFRYLIERRKKREVINAFKKYVAPEVVAEISKSGEFTVNLGGQERDIAVLFVDIRGFTTMSEALEPTEVVKILNEYLALTTNAIFKNKGTLDKFVGDATMAVFNSPVDLDDYEYRAVLAALDIVKGGEALEKDLMEKYGRTVGFGVGVHCGKAVVGNVGCDFRMDFTAIGDTVNTSARLEANAKKGQVLISDKLYERLKGRINVTEIGDIPLKGKSDKIIVYQVDGVADEEAD